MKRKNQFKKGCTPWNKGISLQEDGPSQESQSVKLRPTVRINIDEFSLVTKASSSTVSLSTPDCEGISNSVRLLRPIVPIASENKQRTQCKDKGGMRIIDNDRMAETWNSAFRDHSIASAECQVPDIQILKESKWGVCWKITLHCTKCNFTAPESKLYKEIEINKPGPNAATTNVGLAIGLQDTPVGNTRARVLLSNMDIPPPCRSSMQRTSYMVSKTVTELNTKDMASKVELIKEINTKRDNKCDEINIAMDGRYNSTTITSRKKPGQNASQAIGLACETMTDRQFIISACFQNKLCWIGAWLKNKGIQVTCPGGHPDCTADLPPFAPLSEYEMGKHIGTDLALQGVLIRYVTTDGDSRSSAGVDSALKILDPLWNVQRLADPTHLGQSQFRKCYKANFSADMFCVSTREKKREVQKVFSQDMKARCSLILKDLMTLHTGDVNSIKKNLPKVLESTLLCYSGDCSKCSRYSVVCSGGVTNNWWHRSMFLGIHRITEFNMNENDKMLVVELLKIKLSLSAVEQMKLYTDTQKCEASNRSLSVSLPKNVNFSRTMPGRASSTIHRLNNGPGTSTIQKCKHSGFELSARVKCSLHQMDKETDYHKRYLLRPQVVKKQLLQHGNKIREHLRYKHLNPCQQADYKKGLLDPNSLSADNSESSDHTYQRK